MRQSLAESVAIGSAVALSAVLVVAGIVDQVGGQALHDHAVAVYAPHGEHPSAGLLYGLVYTVAVVDLVLWLVAAGVARRTRRVAPYVAAAVTVVSAALAAALLFSSEYGDRVFPPLWGVLALLPAVSGAVGVLATVQAARLGRTRRAATGVSC